MTDVQAIYCRQQVKLKTVTALCEELGFSRDVVENCIKGRTFKHINNIEKPQV